MAAVSYDEEFIIPRDNDEIVKSLRVSAQAAAGKDNRFQFVLPHSFAVTFEQICKADALNLKIYHHVHDLVMYRMYIEDIHVCVAVLREALAMRGKTKFAPSNFRVLAKEIDDIYSPFLRSNSPPNRKTLDVTKHLVEDVARVGMYLP